MVESFQPSPVTDTKALSAGNALSADARAPAGQTSHPSEFSQAFAALSHLDVLPDFSASGPQAQATEQLLLDNDPRLRQFLTAIDSLKKSGSTVSVHSKTPLDVTLGQQFLSGELEIKSLDLENNLSFQPASQSNGASLNNIRGADLRVDLFGNNVRLPIESIKMNNGSDGTQQYTLYVDNPLPLYAQTVLGTKPTIPINFSFDNQGRFQTPPLSDQLNNTSSDAGTTLPGMVLSQGLAQLSQIAAFAQRYPYGPTTAYNYLKDWSQGNSVAPTSNAPKTSQSGSGTNTGSAAESKSSDFTSFPADGSNKSPDITQTSSLDARTATQGKITGPGDYQMTMNVDGRQRMYLVHVPPQYTGKTSVPLVVVLHGYGGSAQGVEQESHMSAKADQEGFIVLYPQAIDWYGKSQTSAWDTHNGLIPPGEQADDIGFLRNMIDTIQGKASIDPNRIYMAGMSNGAMMTYLAASELSDKLAAVGIICGAMSGNEPKPAAPVSLFITHGTDDHTIPFNGMSGAPKILRDLGVPNFEPDSYPVQFWTKQDGMSGVKPQVKKNGNITEEEYINKNNGTEVDKYDIAGGGHQWPIGVPGSSDPNKQFGATNAMWDFFAAHPKNAKTQTNVVLGPQALPDEPTNHLIPDLENALAEDIKRRGVAGIETDADNTYRAIQQLPDGSINPANMLQQFEGKTKVKFTDPVGQFVSSITDIGKSGHHITIKRSSPGTIALDLPMQNAGGDVAIQSLTSKSGSFDLDTGKNGLIDISNIKGLGINLSAMGFGLHSDLESVKETKAKDGLSTYNLNFANPLPGWARFLLIEPSNVTVDVGFDKKGNFSVQNAPQIKDEILGQNPWFRGIFDTASDAINAWDHPSPSSVLGLVKDAAVIGGATYLGGVLGGGIGRAVGLALSPVLVHAVDSI